MKSAREKKYKPFEIGDRVIEIVSRNNKKRIGEVIFIQEGRVRKLELLQLNSRDLSPVRKGNMELKYFRIKESQCKKLNEFKYFKKEKFRIGDIIRHTSHANVRYGKIVSFVHPDGLYSDSNENGYNGKDLIECVAIKGKDGLPRKIDSTGEVMRFTIGPKQIKVCQILPMDRDGGLRIKSFWKSPGIKN